MNRYILRIYKSKDEILSQFIINETTGKKFFEFKDDLTAIRHLIKKTMRMEPYQEYVISKYVLGSNEKIIANWTNPNEN